MQFWSVRTCFSIRSPLTDKEVAHLMIALLMAGQHTSSTTGTWLGLYLAQDPELQKRLLQEQKNICGDLTKPFEYDTIKDFEFMDKCIKETLRIRPPIITIMRKVLVDQEFKGYTIPAGHYICSAPGNTHTFEEVYERPEEFIPDRTYRGDSKSASSEDKTDSASELERFWYVPFGAGRHRCIGEPFAYVQIKTIMSTMLRMFDIKLDAQRGLPERDWTSLVVLPKAPVTIVYKAREQAL